MNQAAREYLKNAEELALQKKLDLAEIYYMKSLEQDQTDEQFVEAGKFYSYYLNRLDEAERMFRCAIAANDECAYAMDRLAEILYKKGQLHSAHELFNKIIQLPDYENKYRSLYYLALLYTKWNRPERSLRYLSLSLKLNPDFLPSVKLKNKLKNKYLPEKGISAV